MNCGLPLITCELRPRALEDLANLEMADRKAALKAIRTLGSLDLASLRHHKGLNWERLKGLFDRMTGKQLWSFRFGGGARALCILEANSIIVVATLEPDHSKAYRRH